MKKRLTLILIAAMLLTLLPAGAFAAGETPQSGWSADRTVYYENGAPLRNVVKNIDGRPVYFDGNGRVAKFTGWRTINGSRYWANAGGTIVNAPVRIKGTKTVTKKVKWKKVRRKWKYKKKQVTVETNDLYMFGTDGKLITTKGVFSYNGREYCGLGGGVLKTGWYSTGKQAMYFYPSNGQMAKNTTIGHLKVPANGRLGEAYALGVQQLDKSGWDLYAAYKFSYKLKYRDRWFRRKTAEQYAVRGFRKKNGNCYVMASTFYIMAKLLGYDVHQVEGKVAGTHPHSWTVIRHGNREYVYDPNFKNETRRNGWKIWYGKKGTWRYSKYHKMN